MTPVNPPSFQEATVCCLLLRGHGVGVRETARSDSACQPSLSKYPGAVCYGMHLAMAVVETSADIWTCCVDRPAEVEVASYFPPMQRSADWFSDRRAFLCLHLQRQLKRSQTPTFPDSILPLHLLSLAPSLRRSTVAVQRPVGCKHCLQEKAREVGPLATPANCLAADEDSLEAAETCTSNSAALHRRA